MAPIQPEEPDDGDDTIAIEPTEPPLGGPGEGEDAWALWNLILSIAGAVLALMMGIRVLMKKRQERVEEEEDARQGFARQEDEEERKRKRGRLILIFAIPILAIIAIILFILTEDMRLPMIMVDWWTIAHVILFVAGILCYIFAYKREKDEDDNSEQYVTGGNGYGNGNQNRQRRVIIGNR